MARGVFVLLNVSSVEKSLEFYKGLGLKASTETMGPMSWGVIHSGDASLLLFPKDFPDADEETRAWVAGDLGKGVVINIGVQNAQKTAEKARAIRANIDEELHESPWGGRQFMVTDPDGYVLNLMDKFPSAPRKTTKRAAPAKTRKPAKRPAKTRSKRRSR